MSHTYDPYTNVINTMTKAMEIGHIDSSMFEILKNPQRETKVYLPVEMDDGTIGCSRDTGYSTRISAVPSRAASATTRTVI